MNESLNLILNELCCGIFWHVDRFYLIDHFLSFGSKFGQKVSIWYLLARYAQIPATISPPATKLSKHILVVLHKILHPFCSFS